MKKQLAVTLLVVVGLAVTLIGSRNHVTVTRRTTDAPEVQRGTPETLEALAATAALLGVQSATVVHAYVEPNCSGVAVFHHTPEGPIWAWYDRQGQVVSQQLGSEEVLASVRAHFQVDSSGMAWQWRPNGTGGRPRFLVGTVGADELYLEFRTESCGILTGTLEQVQIGKNGRTIYHDVAFSMRVVEDYRDRRQSEPAVKRRTAETTEAVNALRQFVGSPSSYSVDAWVEESCGAVFAHITLEESTVWGLYDLQRRKIRESITSNDVEAAIAQVLTQSAPFPKPWAVRVDTPGERPRYQMAFAPPGVSAWLHLNSRKCTLADAQIQLARDLTDVGTFRSLKLPVRNH